MRNVRFVPVHKHNYQQLKSSLIEMGRIHFLTIPIKRLRSHTTVSAPTSRSKKAVNHLYRNSFKYVYDLRFHLVSRGRNCKHDSYGKLLVSLVHFITSLVLFSSKLWTSQEKVWIFLVSVEGSVWIQQGFKIVLFFQQLCDAVEPFMIYLPRTFLLAL